jgi:hypothetical protein
VTPDRLAAELAALLSDIDAAIAVRFPESRRQDTAPHRRRLRGMVLAALRRLVHSQGLREGSGTSLRR